MKRTLAVLAALFSLSLLGCGGTPVEAEPVGEVSQELVTCSTTCSGGQTLSCSGTTCSAVDNQSVTCDGVTTACACAGLPSCSLYANKRCTATTGTRLDCCNNGNRDYLVCSSFNGSKYWLYE